jgi:hypothetical protein
VSEDPTRGRQESFDELARGLANGTINRRRALKLFAATALGSLIPARFAFADPPGNPHPCPPPGKPSHKVCICHNTGSANNPVVRICVDEHAANAHITNHGDTYCDKYGKCPKKPPKKTTTTTTKPPKKTTTTTTKPPKKTTTTTTKPPKKH